MELAKSIDPGKTPKTDKASIVADAIRVVTQLRTENSQLQQLNKFLEVLFRIEEKIYSHVHAWDMKAIRGTFGSSAMLSARES